MTQPTKAHAGGDGWCPMMDAVDTVASATVGSGWDSDEVKAIFAEMGSVHQASQVNRHNIVTGAQQEVGRIHDELAESTRTRQAEMSQLARQASIGGMAGGFSSGLGPMSTGYYGASGVNTGASVGPTGSMLNTATTAFLNDPRLDDPNYLRTLTQPQLQMMGLDPTMVQLYVNSPGQYPGGLRSMLQSNGSYYNPYR